MENIGISTFVTKIASRCNLNCSYCYMYNMGDETYKKQPKFMNMVTLMNFAEKVNNHIKKHEIPHVYIALHGGEPLLYGVENLKEFIEVFQSQISYKKSKINFVLQTNGVLLTEDIAQQLFDLNIFIGISFDGIKSVHDEFRQYHNGKGSYDDIITKFSIVKNIQERLAIITVINLQNTPFQYYHLLKEHGVTDLNLLLPDSNYQTLPPSYETIEDTSQALYGKYLSIVFDEYQKDEDRIKIAFFENIIKLFTGLKVGDQLIGTRQNNAVTIETNGGIEVVDMMRINEEGITRNDLNINKDELDEVFKEEIYDTYYYGNDKLCDECKNCSLVNICAGGMVVHRYKDGHFNNPSIYCNDLKHIINHIYNYIKSHLHA
ncbi:MAG: radical SAM protein [Aureispira sp.]